MKKKLIILLTIFVLLCISMIFTFTETLDNAIYSIFSNSNKTYLTTFAKFITAFGSAKYITIITLILIIIINSNYKRIFIIANALITTLIISITKNIFSRPRPLIGQALLSSYSFPSGHTLIATTYYGFLIYLLKNSKVKKTTKIIGTILLTRLIILIGLSRIILNVHYLTDVLAGFILGLILIIILIYIYEKNLKH